MKLLFGMLTAVLLLMSCTKDENAILGKWNTEAFTTMTSINTKSSDANLTVAKTTDNEYVVVLDHEGEILTFISTAEAEGIVYIETIDDELNWHYSGEMKIVDEELLLTYGYRNSMGSELPAFNSTGLFSKE